MKITEKNRQKIKKHFLFCGAEESVYLPILERDGKISAFRAGETVMDPATDGKKLGLILSGKTTVTTPDETRNVRLRTLGEGDLFGVANLFSQHPFVSTVKSSGACQVLFLPEKSVGELLSADKTFLFSYLGFLSGRIRFLNRKIVFLTAGSAERRLALYLLSYGSQTVALEESVSALSELLDVGRASLYRAFECLEKDGLLRRERRVIVIPDPASLEKAYS